MMMTVSLIRRSDDDGASLRLQRETTGYESFDLDISIHWAMQGCVIKWRWLRLQVSGVGCKI